MRILMLNNEFPPLGGGTGTVNLAILKRLTNQTELEIDLITSALGRKEEIEHFAERVMIYKVPVNNQNIHHSSNRELSAYAIRAFLLARKLYKKKPYEICFAWSAVPAGAVALALNVKMKLRYIVRVCGPDIPGFEHRYGWLYPLLTPLIRGVWLRAETVVAKCQEEAGMILKVEPACKISIVPNGVDMTYFQPGAQTSDESPLRLLCVARLIERKGQRYLIQAIKNLTERGIDVNLELVGVGDAWSDYRAMVEKLGLSNRVSFVGYVPREQIARHYTAAHAFVLPSYNEGMSVATLEAMASGLPVVVTRTGGTSDLVVESGDNANGFIFDWSDVDTLTDHLHALACDRSLAQRMGAASIRRAQQFTWDRAAQGILNLLPGAASGD